MAVLKFNSIKDLKRQPVAGGFPQPVQAQMKQLQRPKRKVKYPSPSKSK